MTADADAAAAGPAAERLAAIDRLHRSRRQTRNHARPRCTECGFPYPCLTSQIARGEATDTTENPLT